MTENEQDESKHVDDQKTNEAESSDEQRERRVENVPEPQSSLAPVDDDVIIK